MCTQNKEELFFCHVYKQPMSHVYQFMIHTAYAEANTNIGTGEKKIEPVVVL